MMIHPKSTQQPPQPPRISKAFYVEYPPGGLWIGDCNIYPQENDEHSRVHICQEHIILVAWGWSTTTTTDASN